VTDPIRWLTPGMVKAFHQESIGRYGGEPGMLDENLLESALARPANRAGYDRSATIFDPAAEYCAGIIVSWMAINAPAGLRQSSSCRSTDNVLAPTKRISWS
jgi:prophage maintenance system killer protein